MKLLLLLLALAAAQAHVHYHRSHFTHRSDRVSRADAACPPPARCVPRPQCPAVVTAALNASTCALPSGALGLCCSTGLNHSVLSTKPTRRTFLLDATMLHRLLHSSHHGVKDMQAGAPYPSIQRGEPMFGHFMSHRLEGNDFQNGQQYMNQALEGVVASREFVQQNDVSDEIFKLGTTPEIPPAAQLCLSAPSCPRSLSYRTAGGECNNPVHPAWGARFAPLVRLLPPRYADGVWSPRGSVVAGHSLPSPRLVTSTLFDDSDRPHRHATLMLMQFGQFIAHDITFTPDIKNPDGSGINCCSQDSSETHPRPHWACLPIQVPPTDPFYSAYGVNCMSFVRSMLVPRTDCSLGYAQQMNVQSHFVDGSAIYGGEQNATNQLRTFTFGQLAVMNDFGRHLPPLSKNPNDCLTMERGSACFFAGDSRTNQMIGLVVMDLLFVREHNRLAMDLSHLNPHWSDEIVFQEARRIVIAEIQHILYAEWLPVVLGIQAMEDYDLLVTHDGYADLYDPEVNPGIANEFSVAAFRFGHSTADGHLRVYEQGVLDEQIVLADVMFNPARMRLREFYDRFLNTLTTQPMQATDASFTRQLSDYMFRSGNPFGMDLPSTNIQRGRDHALGTYNDYRELSGLPRARRWADFLDRFSSEAVDRLAALYADPEDVELFPAGLLETPVPGAVVGPTFLGIIADQFSRLRRGDRYFYDNLDQPHPFTPRQLEEIKKTTFARLICDNSDSIEMIHVPVNVFLRRDHPGNEGMSCSDPRLERLDMTVFKA